jgi:chromosomal replication initiation ATPase DnaA
MIKVSIEITLTNNDLKDHDKVRGQVLIAFNNALREYRYEQAHIPTHVGIEDIVNIVLEDHPRVSYNQLKSDIKDREVVEIKHVIFYFCRMYTNYSDKYIALQFGSMSHSTVLNGASRIQESIDTYKLFNRRIQLIDIKINDFINLISKHPIYNECAQNNT